MGTVQVLVCMQVEFVCELAVLDACRNASLVLGLICGHFRGQVPKLIPRLLKLFQNFLKCLLCLQQRLLRLLQRRRQLKIRFIAFLLESL